MKTLLNYLESLAPTEKEAEGHRQYEEVIEQLYAQLDVWFSEIGATSWPHVTTVRQGEKILTTRGKGWRRGSFFVLFLPRDYELLGSGAPRSIALVMDVCNVQKRWVRKTGDSWFVEVHAGSFQPLGEGTLEVALLDALGQTR